MTIKRMRVTRVSRETVDVVVEIPYRQDLSNRNVPEEVFRAAASLGSKAVVFESFEMLEQYGYKHPQDAPPDLVIDLNNTHGPI